MSASMTADPISAPITAPITEATDLATLDRLDPLARGRLAMLHPAFGPGIGVPGEASLGDMAKATGLPLDAVLATAGGAIRVVAAEGGCGCGSSCGSKPH